MAIQSTILYDANLGHDKKTGKSLSSVFTMVGSTVVQAEVKRTLYKISTYSSKFYATRKVTEQAMEVQYMLMALGVPLKVIHTYMVTVRV